MRTLPACGLALVLALGAATGRAGDADVDYRRGQHEYRVPDVQLRDRRDRPVALESLLSADRPVVLQFIFTSCQTVCPMLTAMMSQVQDEIRALDEDARIVSISIDPEHDTPARLTEYADRFGAEGDWRFLTGDWPSIRATLVAFDAMYPGQNKMYHDPLTFIRDAASDAWIRLNGLMGAARLMAEYRVATGRAVALEPSSGGR